jgi:hypothetical protein
LILKGNGAQKPKGLEDDDVKLPLWDEFLNLRRKAVSKF